MFVPAKNIVESLDLAPDDVFLAPFECVSNSVLSLANSDTPKSKRVINVRLLRGDLPTGPELIDPCKTVRNFVISDNGRGFDDKNFDSFSTPLSQTYKHLGCKGMGRFTAIAIYELMEVSSTYKTDDGWRTRQFKFNKAKEIFDETNDPANATDSETIVTLRNCFDASYLDRTAISLHEFANRLADHFLVHFLTGGLPKIVVEDSDANDPVDLATLFAERSKDREKTFKAGQHSFKAYVVKEPKKGNRRNHYVSYCANSRVVGERKDLGRINSLFDYPITENGSHYFLNAYVVGEYLDKNAYNTRNAFKIDRSRSIFSDENGARPSFDEIDSALGAALMSEYSTYVKESSDRSVRELKEYIQTKAPRYSSFLRSDDLLRKIPANIPDELKEEHLNRLAYRQREQVDRSLNDFIDKKQINENSIQEIKQNLKERTAYDRDSLADYLMRRKAIIKLFAKFLEADEKGDYRLEEDIHNLIFPMGMSIDEVDYESHNLWLLDERFVTYRFINSNRSVSALSSKGGKLRPDIVTADYMFDNPISFGDKSTGQISSLVVFEFKRPGEVAHQKGKASYRWDFAELTAKYFEDFIYGKTKKNSKGAAISVSEETPKFGYIILDQIPDELARYNVLSRGWKKTPFGSYFHINADLNQHLEVLTFQQLVEIANQRHQPFFDKLFAS